MEINKTMKVSAEEFFDFVKDSIQASLELANSSSDKEVKEGTVFKTKMKTAPKKNEKTRVKVTHLRFPTHIRTEYTSASIRSITEYKIEATDNGCKVQYFETNMDANKEEIKVNGLQKIFMERKLRKRLSEVEKYLLNKKREENQK